MVLHDAAVEIAVKYRIAATACRSMRSAASAVDWCARKRARRTVSEHLIDLRIDAPARVDRATRHA
jgi:hypothetical protein